MTLIIAACSANGALLSSDSRVSGDSLVSDKYVKVFRLKFYDGDLLGAFTGIAGVDGFRFETRQMLLDFFKATAKPWQMTNEFLSAFNNHATVTFKENEFLRDQRPDQKPLTVVLVGYVEDRPFLGLISNREDHNGLRGPYDYFILTRLRGKDETFSVSGAFGARDAVDESAFRAFQASLTRPHTELSDLAEHSRCIIAAAADNALARGTVGGPTTTMTMTPGRNLAAATVTPYGVLSLSPLVLDATASFSVPPEGPPPIS